LNSFSYHFLSILSRMCANIVSITLLIFIASNIPWYCVYYLGFLPIVYPIKNRRLDFSHFFESLSSRVLYFFSSEFTNLL
jgi:hypothetical protein